MSAIEIVAVHTDLIVIPTRSEVIHERSRAAIEQAYRLAAVARDPGRPQLRLIPGKSPATSRPTEPFSRSRALAGSARAFETCCLAARRSSRAAKCDTSPPRTSSEVRAQARFDRTRSKSRLDTAAVISNMATTHCPAGGGLTSPTRPGETPGWAPDH